MYHTPTFCRGRPHSTRKLVARQKIDWRTLVPYTRRLGARGVAGVAPERGFSTGPYTIKTKFGVGRGAAERLPVQGEVSIGFDGAVCFRAGAGKKKFLVQGELLYRCASGWATHCMWFHPGGRRISPPTTFELHKGTRAT